MEAADVSETSVPVYQTTRRHVPEDHNLEMRKSSYMLYSPPFPVLSVSLLTLTAFAFLVATLWTTPPYSLVDGDKRLGGTSYLHFLTWWCSQYVLHCNPRSNTSFQSDYWPLSSYLTVHCLTYCHFFKKRLQSVTSPDGHSMNLHFHLHKLKSKLFTNITILPLILCEYFKEIYFLYLFVAVHTACALSNHLYFADWRFFNSGERISETLAWLKVNSKWLKTLNFMCVGTKIP
jgi:hypothetical protein